MTCRKRIDVAETRLQSLAWDGARRKPADCPSGDRHEDGVRPARGSCVERGNLRLDAKGELQVEDPRGAEYRCEAQGRTGFVVAMKPGNAGGAKGPDSSAKGVGQPTEGRASA